MIDFKQLAQRPLTWWRKQQDRKREAAFIRHNRIVWADHYSGDSGNEILVEVFEFASSIISFSYLANLLAKKHRARIRAYVLGNKGPLAAAFCRPIDNVYRSFGCSDGFVVDLDSPQLDAGSEALVEEILPQIKTKRDIETLTIEGTLIGDLVYDSHLMEYRVPTIDISGDKFRESLKKAFKYYLFWKDYFSTHNVRALIVSHSGYCQFAVVLRLAIQKGIPGYQINVVQAHYLTKKNLGAATEFYYYPEEFLKLSDEEQEKGKAEAKKRLERRFAGEVGVDMSYSTKSAYARNDRRHVLQASPRIKVFIAPHCFFDSPHGYGLNLFPDFFEWVTFLGGISEKTDYDWYLKTHPDFLPGNEVIIDEFLKKYPRFTLLPASTSHLDIVESGVDVALTIYGTIGMEYAALGVSVINASLCNPHIRYGFNVHPKSVEEYRKILMNLADLSLNIDIDQVYEYYYMAFMRNTDNYLFDDYHAFLKEIGGFKNQSGSVSYRQFLKEFSDQKHERIIRSLTNFIESKDYCFDQRHMES